MGGSCDDFIDEGKISLRSCDSVRTSVSTGFLQAQRVSYRTLVCQRLDLRLIQRPSHHLCSTKWFACSAIRVQYLLGRTRMALAVQASPFVQPVGPPSPRLIPTQDPSQPLPDLAPPLQSPEPVSDFAPSLPGPPSPPPSLQRWIQDSQSRLQALVRTTEPTAEPTSVPTSEPAVEPTTEPKSRPPKLVVEVARVRSTSPITPRQWPRDPRVRP